MSGKYLKDFKVINYYAGIITLGTVALMIIPIIVTVFYKEWSSLVDFILALFIGLSIAFSLILSGKSEKENTKIEWKHGLIIASYSWLLLMLICALPFIFSGHAKSYLDACFDVMSGFTTTGVFLMQDLDHMSYGVNMWRHILTFVGGQGMVVLALSILIKNFSGGYKMYVGEGKDIGLLPNIKGTTKAIWKISMIYLIIGTVMLTINGILIGLTPSNSFMHGLFIFASSWSTGGFGPMSQNILYYHSFSYEVVTMIFFTIGSLNFGLHFAVIKGKKKEMFKNIEAQSFFITSFVLTALLVMYLSRTGVYGDAVSLFRKGAYQLLSAHTTTGFGNLYARQLLFEWGDFAILIMTIAMLIGGSACSTAGGFKGLRVGIVFKGIIADIKRTLSSDKKLLTTKIHHIKEIVLDDALVKSSMLIILCYITMFVVATLLGTYYGYSLIESAFEAASVAGNVGLSIGVTSITMPGPLKVCYIIVMYLGRLEFVSIFALIGYFIGGIKKLCVRYEK
ncbi:MAG: potassium transporter TrkG [Clostridium sp.]|uniref:TrkH family potassium uptake protein n=1 Tax=Clostridium sp. TaxID=1506 RepID=UPI00306BC160